MNKKKLLWMSIKRKHKNTLSLVIHVVNLKLYMRGIVHVYCYNSVHIRASDDRDTAVQHTLSHCHLQYTSV